MAIDWNAFTPLSAAIGGALIGLAAATMWVAMGRVAGVSGIVSGILPGTPGERGWRVAFVLGLAVSPWLYAAAAGPLVAHVDAGFATMGVGGLLVGIGTRYGGGCTSGHGVCGLARLAPRSLVATLCFMGAGFATVYLLRHLVSA